MTGAGYVDCNVYYDDMERGIIGTRRVVCNGYFNENKRH